MWLAKESDYDATEATNLLRGIGNDMFQTIIGHAKRCGLIEFKAHAVGDEQMAAPLRSGYTLSTLYAAIETKCLKFRANRVLKPLYSFNLLGGAVNLHRQLMASNEPMLLESSTDDGKMLALISNMCLGHIQLLSQTEPLPSLLDAEHLADRQVPESKMTIAAQASHHINPAVHDHDRERILAPKHDVDLGTSEASLPNKRVRRDESNDDAVSLPTYYPWSKLNGERDEDRFRRIASLVLFWLMDKPGLSLVSL
jgi:hypothetical protein